MVTRTGNRVVGSHPQVCLTSELRERLRSFLVTCHPLHLCPDLSFQLAVSLAGQGTYGFFSHLRSPNRIQEGLTEQLLKPKTLWWNSRFLQDVKPTRFKQAQLRDPAGVTSQNNGHHGPHGLTARIWSRLLVRPFCPSLFVLRLFQVLQNLNTQIIFQIK